MSKRYAYFQCVDARTNHNKFYEAIENDDGSITVRFGREGAAGQTKTYRPYEKTFEAIITDRQRHGYKDITALKSQASVVKSSVATKKTEYKPIEDVDIKILIDGITMASRQFMKNNYTVTAAQITQKMVDETSYDLRMLKSAAETGSVYRFNEILVTLFTDNARKMSKVDDYIAHSTGDFDRILQREATMLDTLRQIYQQAQQQRQQSQSQQDAGNKDETILECNGLTVEPVTYAEEDIILQKLSRKNFEALSNEDTYIRAFSVKNANTEKNYKDYVKKNHITHEELLFHGTKYENLWSIATSGLVLNPDASITGKAFGRGIYFAEHSQKSRGYTSIQGSRWAKGGMSTGMLLMYEVAMGNPFRVDSRNQYTSGVTSSFTESDLKRLGHYDSVYAVGQDCPNGIYRNSEIMIYNQNACTIKYMVEFNQSAFPFSIKYKDRAKMSFTRDDLSIKETENGLEITIKHLPDNMSFLANKITTDNKNIVINYDKHSDTISFNGKTSLTGSDMKWIMRTVKKTYVDSDREWTELMKSPDRQLLGITHEQKGRD